MRGNRTFKIVLAAAGCLAVIVLITIAGLLIAVRAGGDVIELTPEEEALWMEEQNRRYENIDLSGFSAVTVDGEKVTSELFAKHTITMINIWTTDCSSCIAEMPELEKLYQNCPEWLNVISICADAADGEHEQKLAKKIAKKEGLTFKVLVPDEVLKSELTDRTTVFPTTIFVDSTGKTVGGIYSGADEYEGFLKEAGLRLDMVRQGG